MYLAAPAYLSINQSNPSVDKIMSSQSLAHVSKDVAQFFYWMMPGTFCMHAWKEGIE